MPSRLRLLSAGSIRRGVAGVMALFERDQGVPVDADFSSAPKVRARVLAGEAADAVIASSAALEALAAAGRIDAASRTVIGCTGMAVALHQAAAVPDLSDTPAFREAMLAADLLVYNEGSSGLYAAQLVDALGLRARLGDRIRVVPNGAAMFGLIRTVPGKVYGLANVTNIMDEISKGAPVRLAARLPGDIENVTTYEAAVVTGAAQPALAGAFVRMFALDEGRERLAAAGVQAV